MIHQPKVELQERIKKTRENNHFFRKDYERE